MKVNPQLVVLYFWLLSVAIILTIFGIWLLYPLEITWLGLSDVVFLSPKTIWYNFNHLMTYLTLPWVNQLAMPDFRSSPAGLGHFADVKRLFHLVEGLTLILSVPSVLFLKKWHREKTLWLTKNFFLGAMCVPLVFLCLGILLGFDTFFILFHHLLFPNDSSWIFDPSKDPVIWILPQSLFLQAFLLFFVFYELLFMLCFFLCKRQENRI